MKGEPASKFWIFVMPAMLCGIIYYAYSQTGFIARWVQSLVDPLLGLAQAIVNFIFGVNL